MRRSGQLFLTLLLCFGLCFREGLTLMCYICGSSDLEKGECPTQFQYMCTSYAKRFPADEKILCRTMRRRTPDDRFTVLKECIAESEHLKMFPDGKTNGCDTVFDGAGLDVSYCMCVGDFCNSKTLEQQMARLDQISIPISATIDQQEPSRAVIPQITNIAVQTNVGLKDNNTEHKQRVEYLRERPTEQVNVADEVPPPPPKHFAVTSLVQNEPSTTLPTFFAERPTAGSVQGLVCMICGEGELTNDSLDCSHQYAVDCAAQYPPGTAVYCFTRHTVLEEGKNAVEKLCVTDAALIQEYGEGVRMEGCANAWGNQVNYCVCSGHKCNEASIRFQLDADRAKQAEQPGQSLAHGLLGSSKCHVCGESDLNYPADCERSYPYECGLQYGSGTKVYCLTRQTRLTSGLYTIEKRCISEAEHEQHYPGNEIVYNGCSNAWDGQVEYCICNWDMCNELNMTEQARKDQAVTVPAPTQYIYPTETTPLPFTQPPTTTTSTTTRKPTTTTTTTRKTTTTTQARTTTTTTAAPPRPTTQTFVPTKPTKAEPEPAPRTRPKTNLPTRTPPLRNKVHDGPSYILDNSAAAVTLNAVLLFLIALLW